MQSIAVPVSLTLQQQPEGADMGSPERAVGPALAEAGRGVWDEVIRTLEALLPMPRGHVGCGGILKANGRAPRRIVTLAGEVGLRRRRYRCGACEGEVVPLDALLGLEPRAQHTLGVWERALFVVTELSYAKTARAWHRTLDRVGSQPALRFVSWVTAGVVDRHGNMSAHGQVDGHERGPGAVRRRSTALSGSSPGCTIMRTSRPLTRSQADGEDVAREKGSQRRGR